MIAIDDLPQLDYADPDYQRNPFEWLAKCAVKQPMARSDRGVEVLEYKLVRRMLMHESLGTDHANLVEHVGMPESRALEFKRNMLLTHNRGDTRRRLRKVLTGLLGRAEAEAMRGDVRDVVSELLDGLSGNQVDLKAEFTDLVPASVYCSWVEAPLSDARFVADMSDTVLSIFQRDPGLTPRIVAAYDELFAYARVRLAEREAAPGKDFLSRLIDYRDAGELSTAELEDFAVMLIEASTDNTTHQIAIVIDRLSAIPGLWSELGKHPDKVSGCVREVMRLWPRSISTSRTALEDTTLGDVEIPRGSSLFASFGACHRQSDVFNDSHTFLSDRKAHPSHMNFGGGAFSCLGQFIASIEVEEAVSQMTRRFPTLDVMSVKRDYTPMFQSISQLPVRLVR